MSRDSYYMHEIKNKISQSDSKAILGILWVNLQLWLFINNHIAVPYVYVMTLNHNDLLNYRKATFWTENPVFANFSLFHFRPFKKKK